MTQVDTTPTSTPTTLTPTTTTANGLGLDRCVIRAPIPESAVTVPPSIPLGQLLYARLRTHDPDTLFMAHVEDPDRRRLTYGELLQGALGLAHGLVDKVGLRNGDRLAVLSPNHEHYFIADFACMFAGAFLVKIDVALDLAKLAHEPRVILLDSPATPSSATITINAPQMHDLIVPGQVALPSTIAQVQLDDTVFFMFTS
ncbi:hypothetical protein GGF32_005275, partial [Allomyces javanicus]